LKRGGTEDAEEKEHKLKMVGRDVKAASGVGPMVQNAVLEKQNRRKTK